MDAGVVAGLLQIATQGLTREEMSSFSRRREQKASHRKRLRRRGAVCGVAAPLRCAEASPSSRLLASSSAALATPPHTLFQQPAGCSPCFPCHPDLMRVLPGTSGYSYAEWKGSFYPEDL